MTIWTGTCNLNSSCPVCPPPVLRASRARARDDDDSFDPEFEVDTPQMNAWIEKVKAEEDEADQE